MQQHLINFTGRDNYAIKSSHARNSISCITSKWFGATRTPTEKCSRKNSLIIFQEPHMEKHRNPTLMSVHVGVSVCLLVHVHTCSVCVCICVCVIQMTFSCFTRKLADHSTCSLYKTIRM